MTNINHPKGAAISGALLSAEFNTLANQYIVSSSNPDDFFIGMPVITNETSIDGVPVVVKSGGSGAIRGYVISIENDTSRNEITYLPARTQRKVLICDDPNVEYEMQVNGTLLSTDIGKNFDLVMGAGNLTTGLSGAQIDLTTRKTGTALLKILSIVERVDNEVGLYSKVRCKTMEHELSDSGSGSTLAHNALFNLAYNLAGHGTGYTGFQRGTTLSAISPTVNDDSSIGYVGGDFWLNQSTSVHYTCVDAAIGSAIWVETFGQLNAKQPDYVVAFDGQILFTLPTVPNGPDSFGLYLNGQMRLKTDYIFTGTTLIWQNPGGLTLKAGQIVVAWYDFTAPSPLILDQKQIYYRADSGANSNDGKSVERPFLTMTKASTTVLLQTPSASNRFEIQSIGASVITENWTMPDFTTVNAPSTKFIGTITMSGATESKIICDELTAPNSAAAIYGLNGGILDFYIKANLLNGGTNSIGIDATSAPLIRTDIKKIDMSGTGSKAYNINISTLLYLNYGSLRENAASTKSGGALIFENGTDSGANGDTVTINEVGNYINRAKTSQTFGSSVGDYLELTASGPKWITTSRFIARVATIQYSQTGDANLHTVLFGDVTSAATINLGGHYDKTTGIFTAPVAGIYAFSFNLLTENLNALHTIYRTYIDVNTVSPVGHMMDQFNGATARAIDPPNIDAVTSNGSQDIILYAGNEVRIIIQVGPSTAVRQVDILPESFFTGRLITRI